MLPSQCSGSIKLRRVHTRRIGDSSAERTGAPPLSPVEIRYVAALEWAARAGVVVIGLGGAVASPTGGRLKVVVLFDFAPSPRPRSQTPQNAFFKDKPRDVTATTPTSCSTITTTPAPAALAPSSALLRRRDIASGRRHFSLRLWNTSAWKNWPQVYGLIGNTSEHMYSVE